MASAPLRCPRCEHENPAGVKFCGECGARLETACGGCGATNPMGNKFCHGCGAPLGAAPARAAVMAEPAASFASPRAYTPRHLAEKILTSRSALEGERKQVTVLFVDISGFTALSERLDPEDVHRLMTRAFELILAEVHRYEGTVNQFLGDGVMALFGAPIAHEDHAQRAVHAALGIRRALDAYQEELERRQRVTFQVRQGLNTGLVVVGSIGTDLRMDYTAVGDTTNVAARMQQAAERGRIFVSEATHRLVEPYFYTRALGPLAVKGKADAVRAWEVVAARVARTRLDVAAERGLTPYVGRERELGVLFDCFEKTKAGQGQVVFVVGEPGIGKSRLLYEFRRRLGDEATWLEGRCMSFGQSIALHPVIDMLKRNFHIEEGDTEATIARKVERAVLRLGEDLGPIVPYLRYLLSVDPGDPAVTALDPQQRRGEIFDALRRLLVRASQVRPQIVVHEDVHWMDTATEESLLFVADSIPTHRILHILTYRTGYTQPFGDRSYHHRVVLGTLSTADSVGMARAMLSTNELPRELQALIARKAEGNPFFVEEVVKSLQEVGVLRRTGDGWTLARPLDEVVVPDTIQDVIMARIDRLPEAPKKTLQLASVIGREFTRRLLDRIADVRDRSDDLLHELKAIELIYEKALFPELAYMFKHALTHEVAYNSLLIERRKELHRAIARAVEELYADRVGEHYEVLAYHFAKAEDWPKALEYFMKAGDKAARAFANREAAALYAQAAEAATRLGPAVDARTWLAIHQARLGTYQVLSEFDRAIAEGEQALAVARELGDTTVEASVLAAVGFAAAWGHRFDMSLETCRRAIDLSAKVGAPAVAASAEMATSLVRAVTGHLDEATACAARARRLGLEANEPAATSMALAFEAQLLSWQARYAEGEPLHAEALRLARGHNLVVPLIWGLWQAGLLLIGKGDYERARALLDEDLALCEKVGDQAMALRVLNTLGWLWIECGDLERALEYNRRGAEGARKRGDPETIANPELNLADVFIAKGDLALAAEFLDGVQRILKDPTTSEWMKWRYSMHLFASQSDLALARGDLAGAGGFAEQCLEIATRTGARRYAVRAGRARGEIALAARRWDDAGAALGAALEMARAIANPPQLWRTCAALARLHEARGDAAGAARALEEGWAVFDGVKARVADPDLRAALDTIHISTFVPNA